MTFASPTFVRAIFMLYAARAALGWLVALPVTRAVGASGVSRLAEGDAALFEPGALFLSELFRTGGPELRAALDTSLLYGFFALTLLIVPNAHLFASAPKALERASAWPRALGLVPRFILVGVLEVLAVGLVFAAFALTAGAISAALARDTLSEKTQSLALLGGSVPALLALGLVHIGADLTRAHSAREERRLIGVLKAARDTFRDKAVPLLSGYTLASGTSLLLVALASRAVELLHVERPTGLPVLFATLVHQATLLGLCVIRGLWVRRVDSLTPNAPHDA